VIGFRSGAGVAFAQWGRVALVDDVNGNDATGAVNGPPFKTVQSALAAVAAGDQVYILPGSYDLPAAGVTIPAGVAVRGISTKAVTLRRLLAVAPTTLITMGEDTRLEDVAVQLQSAAHVDLTGVAFPGTTSATAKIRTCTITVDNSGAGDAGNSKVVGVHSFGTGLPDEVVDAIRATTIDVRSSGTGTKRAILLDTSAHAFRARDTNAHCHRTGAAAGSYIAVETAHVGVLFEGRSGTYHGTPTADISQTLGVLSVQSVNLESNNANGLGFNTVLAPSTIGWGVTSGLPVGTRFLRRGTTSSAGSTELLERMPRMIIRRLSIRAVSPPGGAITDTVTLRKNGVDTALSVSLTGAATSASNGAVSVPFAAGDDISMKVVTSAGSGLADVIVTAELY
jgi:hypothetical protein